MVLHFFGTFELLFLFLISVGSLLVEGAGMDFDLCTQRELEMDQLYRRSFFEVFTIGTVYRRRKKMKKKIVFTYQNREKIILSFVPPALYIADGN